MDTVINWLYSVEWGNVPPPLSLSVVFNPFWFTLLYIISRDLRSFEIRFELAVQFDSKVIGRFENFWIKSAVPAPLLIASLVKRLKPLTALKRLLQLRFDFDSTMTKNEHVHFFVTSRVIVANKKAVGWAYSYNDVIVYITVTKMAFTMTDQHRLSTLV